MRVWTWIKHSFKLGGTWEVLASEVGDPETTFRCRGFLLGAYRNPHTGGYHIADMTSGGLVGIAPTKEQAMLNVILDIARGDPQTMRRQVDEAKETGEHPDTVVQPDEFWKKVAKSKKGVR